MHEIRDVIREVPFYPQAWRLSRWRQEGYVSKEDMSYWQDSSCGVLCLEMVIEYFTHQQIPTRELIQKGVKLGAYTDASGWRHQGLVDLGKTYGLTGEAQPMTVEDIARAIDRGSLVIVSIRPNFRGPRTLIEWLKFWKRRGGHLAVIVGARWQGQRPVGLYVHHTSSLAALNRPKRYLPLRRFSWGYTGRAITLRKSA